MKRMAILAVVTATALHAQVNKPVEVPYMPFPIKMGKGFETVQAQCLMCHSFGYVLNQGRQSRKFWRGKIEKMIVHFKAPISDKDAKIIEEYLVEHYGNGK